MKNGLAQKTKTIIKNTIGQRQGEKTNNITKKLSTVENKTQSNILN